MQKHMLWAKLHTKSSTLKIYEFLIRTHDVNRIANNISSNAVFRIYIIKNFFIVSKQLKIYTYIYETQLYFQNLMRANKKCMAGHIWPEGRSLDTPVLDAVNRS